MVRRAKLAGRLPLALGCVVLFALASAAPLLADSVIGSGGQPQPLYPITGQPGSTPPASPPPASHGPGADGGRLPAPRHSSRPGGVRDLRPGAASTEMSGSGSGGPAGEPGGGANGGSAPATGVVQSVSDRGIVLRELDGTTVSVAAGNGTTVTIDGAPASLAEVRPGYVVEVEWAADGSAASLAFVRSG